MSSENLALADTTFFNFYSYIIIGRCAVGAKRCCAIGGFTSL